MAPEIEYLAQPSGPCCLKGKLHDGKPCGSLVAVADVETYISLPCENIANGHIILYFPDISGLSHNGRLVMDRFANAGYVVLGLDYFRGDVISKHLTEDSNGFVDGFDFEHWKAEHMNFAIEVVPRWIEEVKTKYGKANTRYGCIGYCFGAPFVCDGLAGDGFTAGAFAHPAFLKEEHFREVKKPLLLSCAENDVAFDSASRRKAVDILQAEKKQYQVQLLSGVEHGFALKGDISRPYENFAKEQSIGCMISWFGFWMQGDEIAS